MKSIFFLFMLSALVACQKSEKGSSCDPYNETCLFNISQRYTDDEGALSQEALNFETNLLLVNFGVTEQDKILKASEAIKKVVASEEFRHAVLNHSYNGQKTFVDNGGLTNSQIYHRFLNGAELLNQQENNTLDAELELYYENNSTVGHTNPGTERIWMNTKYFNQYSSAQVAGNLVHEWLHKLGFGHSSSSNPSRPYSVPYAVGYIMTNLAKKHL